MRVFISWSGEPSRSVAKALRDWLPMVVQHVEPWMSDEDIDSGGRWNDQVAAELERADYGIICLTSANLERPWLVFEAGALAKRFDVARVVPLLIDLKPADVTMPLASFQGRPLSEDGMLRLVRDINAYREPALPDHQIDQLFAGMWPMLHERVLRAMATQTPDGNGEVSRRAEDVMAELVETVRRIDRRLDRLELVGSPVTVPDEEATFSVALRRALQASGHTQSWLAEQLHTDPGQVSRWVHGKAVPHPEVVDRIEDVLEAELMDALKATVRR